jgi:hypothetical protein
MKVYIVSIWNCYHDLTDDRTKVFESLKDAKAYGEKVAKQEGIEETDSVVWEKKEDKRETWYYGHDDGIYVTEFYVN